MFPVFMFDHYLGIPYSHDMCPCSQCFPHHQPCHDPCRPDTVSCPLVRDNTIIQQPAILTTLTNTYTQEAVKFIKVKIEIDKIELLPCQAWSNKAFVFLRPLPISGLLSNIQSKF